MEKARRARKNWAGARAGGHAGGSLLSRGRLVVTVLGQGRFYRSVDCFVTMLNVKRMILMHALVG